MGCSSNLFEAKFKIIFTFMYILCIIKMFDNEIFYENSGKTMGE